MNERDLFGCLDPSTDDGNAQPWRHSFSQVDALGAAFGQLLQTYVKAVVQEEVAKAVERLSTTSR